MAKKIPAEKLIDWKKIGAIMQKNLTVLLRDKTRVIPLLLFPIFMIVVFGFTTGNTPKHIPTALVIYDESSLSQSLQQQIESNQVFTVRSVVSTEGEAKRLLDDGSVKVIIEIPPHLQESINGGGQASVVVIVDDSDAALAATAHATISSIVSEFASKIGEQKLAEFQRSVDVSAGQLQGFILAQPDVYGQIAQKTRITEGILRQIETTNDQASQKILLAAPAPSIYIAPSTQTGNQNISGNTSLPLGSDASTNAPVAIMKQTSTLAKTAEQNAHDASALAMQAQHTSEAMQEYQEYDTRVLEPLRTIHLFTISKTENILRPVTYEEKAAYGTGKRAVDFLIPAIIALTIFQGAIMGMGRAVAGEKREGSLTRVFLTPTSNATIILGTLLFYILFELCRSAFLIGVAILLFNIKIEGSIFLIAIILAIYTGIPTSIGMILSSAVRTEGQYMALAMLVSMPMMFLAGVFLPLQAMPPVLQKVASLLPVTYAADALRGVIVKGFSIGFIIYPLFILLIYLTISIALLFMVFKRDIE